MKPLIQKLVETISPSGYENPIRQVIRAEIEPYASQVRVDALGNLIAEMGSSDGKKIMLSAHMDEIGVMVTHIDENGFIRFVPIGGVRPLNCVGGRVRFMSGQAGVIYMEKPDDPNRAPSFDQLYIDVGEIGRAHV